MHSALLSLAYLVKDCRKQNSVCPSPGNNNYSFPKCDEMLNFLIDHSYNINHKTYISDQE